MAAQTSGTMPQTLPTSSAPPSTSANPPPPPPSSVSAAAARKRKRSSADAGGQAPSADYISLDFGGPSSNSASSETASSASDGALTGSTGAGSKKSKSESGGSQPSKARKTRRGGKGQKKKGDGTKAKANVREDDTDDEKEQAKFGKNDDDDEDEDDKDALVKLASAAKEANVQSWVDKQKNKKLKKSTVGADGLTRKQRRGLIRKEKRALKKMQEAEQKAAFPSGPGGRFDSLQGEEPVESLNSRFDDDLDSDTSPSSPSMSDSEDSAHGNDKPEPTMTDASIPPAPSNSDGSTAVETPPKSSSPATVLAHQKYFKPYTYPRLYHEEDRAMFAPHNTHDIRATTLSFMNEYIAPPQESIITCHVCTFTGHTSSDCPDLTCAHCSQKNSHPSHCCPKKTPVSPSTSSESSTLDWRAIKPHRLLTPESPHLTIRMFCYHCASSGHFGDDCPRLPVPDEPGSFSIEEMKLRGYISEEKAQELEDVTDSDPRHRKFGQGALEGEVPPSWDPFEQFKKSPVRPVNVDVRGSYGGNGGSRGGGYGSGNRYGGGGGGVSRAGGRPPPRDRDRYDGGRRDDRGGNSYRPSSYAARNAWNQYRR